MSLLRYPMNPDDFIGVYETDHERRTVCHLINRAFVDGYQTGVAARPEDLLSHWTGDLATGYEAHTKEAYAKRDKLLDNLPDKY